MENEGNSETSEPCSQDELLALEIYMKGEIRPSISDKLRVGVYDRENASQTDLSEILELKELTGVLQTLVKSYDVLKKDVILHKNILQAEYEQKIQAQASELYGRINNAVRDLEAVHKKKVSTLRRSFQTQLIDALAVIRAKYERGDVEDHKTDTKALKQKVSEQDILINSLKAQILELEEHEHPTQIVFESEDDPEKERLVEENREMKEEIDTLQDKIQQLENVLMEKEKHIRALELDVGAIKQKMEKDQKTIEKLLSESNSLKIEFEKEKSAMVIMLQQQKEEMETIMKTKLLEKEKEQARIEQEHQARLEQERQARLKQESESQILEDIQKQRQLLLLETEQLKKIQQKVMIPTGGQESGSEEKEKLLAQIKKLLHVKEEHEMTIHRLRREPERINKMWEKKFEILKHSYHAIKDEMFLRQSLHRQAMNLHRVSVSYMMDGIGTAPASHPAKNNFYLPTLPLPQIRTKSPTTIQPTEFGAGYTEIEEQDAFSEDELQVISDDAEAELEGIPAFPPPPALINLMK
ncbi:uncharacterized protein C10orf67 homolog, mitochondrial [Spea bombifrons]|uniref:uncharacterized protein C10orf67 homolog, mitochondrial n=1 Tax=Spea bombifrons TaxID=233779 RepID=UPI00234B66F2|nr:uncharacterized protein C10orf67 homolog, mitochondrial [Spea bombifrons]